MLDGHELVAYEFLLVFHEIQLVNELVLLLMAHEFHLPYNLLQQNDLLLLKDLEVHEILGQQDVLIDYYLFPHFSLIH